MARGRVAWSPCSRRRVSTWPCVMGALGLAWAMAACTTQEASSPAPVVRTPARALEDGNAIEPGPSLSASTTGSESAASSANCDDPCDLPPCRQGRCGDGVVQSEEECDDGNLRSGDVCTERCTHTADDLFLFPYGVCIHTVAGTVKCWGRGDMGALGQGDREHRADTACTVPRYLAPLDFGKGEVVQLLGEGIPCVLLESGKVKCWGNNGAKTMPPSTLQTIDWGDEPGEMGEALPTIGFGEGAIVVGLQGDLYNYCARFGDGSGKCWGVGAPLVSDACDANCTVFKPSTGSEFGQRLAALPLGPGRSIRQLTATSGSSCAVLDDWTVRCWGKSVAQAPKRISPGDRLFAAGSVMCWLSSKGELRCWGDAGNGVLGMRGLRIERADICSDGPGPFLPVPRPPRAAIGLGSGRRVVDVALSGTYVCVTMADGTLRCWGRDNDGELGLGRYSDGYEPCCTMDERDSLCRQVPPERSVALGTQSPIKKVAVSLGNTCVLFEDGNLKCWGNNQVGQLGYGDTNLREQPPVEYVPY